MSKMQFNVHDSDGEHVAATKGPIEAAILAAAMGQGTTIRDRWLKRILWREGHEAFSAGESYDSCAILILQRRQEARLERYRKTLIPRPQTP